MTWSVSVAAGRRWLAAVAGCLVALVFVLAVASPADASKLSQDKARARAIAQEVAALDQRLAGIVEAYAAASATLASVNEQILANEEKLVAAEQQLDEAQNVVTDRAVAMYKERPVTLVDVLVGSSSFGDMLSQLQFLTKLNEYDHKMVVQLQRTRQKVADRRQQLLADRATARKALAEQKTEKARIKAALGERRTTLTQLRGEIQHLEATLHRPIVQTAPSLEPSPSASPSSAPVSADAPSGGWWPLIREAAAANGIDAKGMYRLMMIESAGQANNCSSGMFYGLYQYYPATWKASWNPWRNCNICDGAAQIKATALALKMGKGPYWWTNSYRWAFGVD
jgi:predicted  nucleic acid-binding Zn-ribbon protein